jgi:hypothetical protein
MTTTITSRLARGGAVPVSLPTMFPRGVPASVTVK